MSGQPRDPSRPPVQVLRLRPIILLAAALLVTLCSLVDRTEAVLRAQSAPAWIRKVYPDYDPTTGRIPSVGSKVLDVLSAGQPDAEETVALLIRVAAGPDGPQDCDECSRLIDFALIGPDSKLVAFQRGILEMDGLSRLSIVPDEFYHGSHKQVMGVRIQRSWQGVESEALFLIDFRPPPRTVLEVQTNFSTCGAPGADASAGTSRTHVHFDTEGDYPITLETTRQDCRGHQLGRTVVPLIWDSRVRHFVAWNPPR